MACFEAHATVYMTCMYIYILVTYNTIPMLRSSNHVDVP